MSYASIRQRPARTRWGGILASSAFEQRSHRAASATSRSRICSHGYVIKGAFQSPHTSRMTRDCFASSTDNLGSGLGGTRVCTPSDSRIGSGSAGRYSANRPEQEPDYVRGYAPEPNLAMAVVNAADVVSPEDLAHPSATCWIKMSEVGIEGLRQAFLDPGSRIRLHSQPPPEERAELVAMGWQGGFLDGAAFHFSPNLNVLVGGRGAGKSTVIESLRHVLGLEPLGEEARATHMGVVRNVLRSGTKVSLLVRCRRPSPREYRIERTIPNPPVVRDAETGNVLSVTPADVFRGVEVYGQHEISELTKSPEKLTRLLGRFVEKDDSVVARKRELQRNLERSRGRMVATREELDDIDERLAALPGSKRH